MMRLIILTGLLWSVMSYGYGQCCSQGTPLGGNSNQGVLPKNSWRLMLFYTYSYSDRQNPSSNESIIKDAYFNYSGMNISYGLFNKTTLELESGYFLNKTQRYDFQPEIILKGKGMSNGLISAKQLLFKSEKAGIELAGAIGGKFPYSRKPYYYDGVELPVDNQPSTGAFGVVPRLLLFKKIPQKKMGFFFLHRTDINFPNAKSYLYGTTFTNALFWSKSLGFISCNTSFLLLTQQIIRKKDEYKFQEISTTGSHTVSVSPMISHSFFKKYNLTLGADVPIYQKYNSTKLARKFALLATFVTDF